MFNDLNKRFALIGVIIMRSNRWRHSIKRLFSCVVYLTGKPMTPHLPRYQDLAVDKTTAAALTALDLRYPRLLQQGLTFAIKKFNIVTHNENIVCHCPYRKQNKRLTP